MSCSLNDCEEEDLVKKDFKIYKKWNKNYQNIVEKPILIKSTQDTSIVEDSEFYTINDNQLIDCTTQFNDIVSTDAKLLLQHNAYLEGISTKMKIFNLKDFPGFYIVPNAISDSLIEFLTSFVLRNLTGPPFINNFNNLNEQVQEPINLWSHSIENYGDLSFLKKSLRWIHLGYFFDYNRFQYDESKYNSNPVIIKNIFEYLAKCLGFSTFEAQTSILNFYSSCSFGPDYRTGQNVCGHVDIYEKNLDQPLLSLSMGQSAIFLIGHSIRHSKSKAIWLRNGDLVIMSGPSRNAYHSVPYVGPIHPHGKSPLANHSLNYDCSNIKDSSIREFLDNSRFNINVRHMK